MNFDICSKCKARERCKVPCPPVDTWADGNKPLKEYLGGLDMDRYQNRDYKTVLIEMQEARQISQHNKPRPVEDFERFQDNPRLQIIALALNAKIKIKQIAIVFNITERTVRRIKRHKDIN